MCPGSRDITSPRRLLVCQDTSDDIFKNMDVNKLSGMKRNKESSVIQQNGSIKSMQSNKVHNPNNTKLTQTEISLSDDKIVFSKPQPLSMLLISNQICERKVMDKEKNIAKIEVPEKFTTKPDVCVSKSRETAETKTNKVKKAFKRLFDIFKVS